MELHFSKIATAARQPRKCTVTSGQTPLVRAGLHSHTRTLQLICIQHEGRRNSGARANQTFHLFVTFNLPRMHKTQNVLLLLVT